jgi:hypothetical protein
MRGSLGSPTQTMRTFFGFFDIAVLVVLLLLNRWAWPWRVRARRWLFLVLALPLFGLVLPILSMAIESHRYMQEDAGVVVDAFETAYTLFRFPEYWALGIIQLLVVFLPWHRKAKADEAKALSTSPDSSS